MLADDQLLALTSAAVFKRGRNYARQGRVSLTWHDQTGLQGKVAGQDTYSVSLKRDGERWLWNCTCPAADDGAFCKHLVAAVLDARDGGDHSGESEVAPTTTKGSRQQQLKDFLRAQKSERLVAWLIEFAGQDRTIRDQLELARAADDPAELKKLLSKALSIRSFADYRQTMAFARKLDPFIEQLNEMIKRDAAAGRELCEYALKRLFKALERCDDSSGALSDRLATVADMHAAACQGKVLGKSLVKPLLALQHLDQWSLLPLAAYWSALGEAGQAEYGKQVLAELDALPDIIDERNRWGDSFYAMSRAEDFARQTQDFELLQRILRKRMFSAHDHLRLIEAMREFGREREALALAEQAAKQFPDNVDLRRMLAQCLDISGLDSEALDQLWQAFVIDPREKVWDELKLLADANWPTWRQRALEHLASLENQEASRRIQLLVHDGDIDAAASVAQQEKVWPDTLLRLAHRIEASHPQAAGEFYLRLARVEMKNPQLSRYGHLVGLLQRASLLLPSDQWQPLLCEVRTEHGKKIKLMGMLDEAGL